MPRALLDAADLAGAAAQARMASMAASAADMVVMQGTLYALAEPSTARECIRLARLP